MRSFVKLELVLTSLLIVFGYAIPAHAETFDSFSNGELHGQNGWLQDSGDTTRFTVGSGYVTSGKSVYIEGTGCSGNVCSATTTFTQTDYFSISAKLYSDDLRDGDIYIAPKEGGNQPCWFGFIEETSGKVEVVLKGEQTKKLGQPATSTWTAMTMFVNTVDKECTLNYNGISTTTPYKIGEYPSVALNELQVNTEDSLSFSTTLLSIDDLVQTLNIQDLSTQNDCEICTRIVQTDPGQETVSASYSRDYSIDYYVATEDYLEPASTYIEMYYTHALSYPTLPSAYNIYTETFRSSVFSSGLNTAIFNLANTYATGTYNVSIRIYNEDDPAWWEFWKDTEEIDVLRYSTYFHVNTYTTAEEIALERQNAEESSYFTNFGDEPSLKSFLDGYVDTITHGAPFGYATRVYEIFMATTSSSTSLSITHTFPSTSPAYGTGITLNIGQAGSLLTNTIGQDNYNKIMTVWNFLWYTLLFFWIVKELYGISFITNQHSIKSNKEEI